jgi:MFS family permease
MLPELQRGLHTTLSTVAWSFTAYMVPFAGLMLVSGTLAEYWGRARTLRAAYIGYALACLLCAVAGNATVFLTGRALQGVANAFTSPLLIALISEVVTTGQLGSALGRLGGWGAAGQAFAPLIGGVAAAVDYRWAFLAAAGAAVLLTLVPAPTRPDPAWPPGTPGDPTATPTPAPTSARADPGQSPGSKWRALRNRRLVLACAVAFSLYLTTSGLTLLVALLAGDRFGLGPQARGLVVAGFGIAGLLTGARFGGLVDVVGLRPFAIASAVLLAGATAAAGLSPVVAVLVATTALGGIASTAGRVATNTLAVNSTPANRGGATSMTLAWQFIGSALAPLLLLPVYHRSVAAGFAVAGLASLGGAVLLAVSRQAGQPAERTAA